MRRAAALTLPLTRERAITIFEDTRRRQGYATSTRALDRRVLRALLPRLCVPLARVRREHVVALLAARAREVARNTAARELGTLRRLFAALVDAGHLARDPTQGLALACGPTRPPLVLAPDDVARLFVVALDERERAPRRAPAARRALALRDRACLELLYGLGLRAAEVHAARVVDLVLERGPGANAGTLLVRRVKRGEPRHLPLPPSSLSHLARYLREGRPHLVRGGLDDGRLLLTIRGTPVSPDELWRIVSKLARRAQVRAHPHTLRRSLATSLVLAGASLVAVQDLLGHVRLDTTQRYVAVDRHELRRAADALDAARGGQV